MWSWEGEPNRFNPIKESSKFGICWTQFVRVGPKWDVGSSPQFESYSQWLGCQLKEKDSRRGLEKLKGKRTTCGLAAHLEWRCNSLLRSVCGNIRRCAGERVLGAHGSQVLSGLANKRRLWFMLQPGAFAKAWLQDEWAWCAAKKRERQKIKKTTTTFALKEKKKKGK